MLFGWNIQTYNQNIPLRNLFYLNNLYEKMIKRKNANLYGSKIIKIPTPYCIVFYNGTKEQPDKMELKISTRLRQALEKRDIN